MIGFDALLNSSKLKKTLPNTNQALIEEQKKH